MEPHVKKSLLIVDDDPSNLAALIHLLQDDYKIYAAKNGQTAVKNAKKLKPDMILLDVVMPDLSGYEVLSTLRENEETCKIPVVMISGLNSMEDERNAMVAGAAGYIAKPFDRQEVITKVKRFIA